MKNKYLILFSLSGVILSFDQLTKHLIRLYIPAEQSQLLVPNFLYLTNTRNGGFAYELLKRSPQSFQEIFFIGVPVFALVLIVLIFIKLQDDQMVTSYALTTILAGAIGNLIDRVQYGFVVDFIELKLLSFGHVSAFNIADCSIMIGVGMMFINTLFHSRIREVG